MIIVRRHNGGCNKFTRVVGFHAYEWHLEFKKLAKQLTLQVQFSLSLSIPQVQNQWRTQELTIVGLIIGNRKNLYGQLYNYTSLWKAIYRYMLPKVFKHIDTYLSIQH